MCFLSIFEDKVRIDPKTNEELARLHKLIDELHVKISRIQDENVMYQHIINNIKNGITYKEYNDIQQKYECKICFENAVDCFYSKCGHCVCCQKCALKRSGCYVCEMESEIVPLYYS